MSRFLFVVPPLTGHVNPTVAVGEELAARGHAVAWTGHSEIVAPLLPPWAELIPLDHELPVEMIASTRDKAMTLRGVAALEFLWRDFLRPLAAAMIPGVDAAARNFVPDAMVVDQQAFAGAIVARRLRLPWATSATTSAELVDPFRALPKVGEWVAGQLAELQTDAGLGAGEVGSAGDLRFSEHLTIAFTTSALTGQLVLPAGSGPVVMVGPSLTARRSETARLPDAELAEFLRSDGRRVLVTLGTVNAEAGGRFFSAVVEAALAAAERPTTATASSSSSSWRALLVAPREIVRPVPPTVFVAPDIPQLHVLDHVDAVVCHAGHNTVCETLSKGLPLVVAPIRDDQPVIAEQVEGCGAGVRVRFGRVRGEELMVAIDSVLDEPRYRAAAERVQSSFEAAGGEQAAADSLEALVA